METNLIVQLVSALGSAGVLAWYCWYVTSTTLPRLVKEFREETAAARADAVAEREYHRERTDRMTDLAEKMIQQCAARTAAADQG